MVLTAVLLSACSTFHDYQAVTQPPLDNPVIFVQINPNVKFSPALLLDDPDSLLTQILLKNEQIHAADPDAPYITAAEYLDEPLTARPAGDAYQLSITVANVPDTTVSLTTEPFIITRESNYFNPLTLLPDADVPVMQYVTCYYGLTSSSEPRHTTATTVAQQADGSYALLWSSPDAITFVDYYPNRPLYYVIALAVGAVVLVVTWGLARYFYCKMHRHTV